MFGRVLTAASNSVSVTLPSLRSSPPLSIRLSTGRLARLAPSSALLTTDDTTILATLSHNPPAPSPGFVPLLIDFRAKAAAVGIIPSTWSRRELQPAVQETLTARLIDRALRPALANPHLDLPPTQLTVSVLSSAMVPSASIDALAANAAAAVIMARAIDCKGVGAVRVALIEGAVVPFPSEEQLAEAEASVFVAANKDGRVLSMTVEGRFKEIQEENLMRILRDAVPMASKIAVAQEQFRDVVKEMKREHGESSFPRKLPYRSNAEDEVKQVSLDQLHQVKKRAFAIYAQAFKECRTYPGKAHRADVVTRAQQELVDDFPDIPMEKVLEAAREATKRAHSEVLLRDGLRIDGRKFDEIRTIRCETDFLPGDVHGSGLFERGDTQVLAFSTTGLKSQAMRTEKYVTGGMEKSFFVHYSFPPYATGDYGRFAGHASRREIGHSDLTEKAILPVLDLTGHVGKQERPHAGVEKQVEAEYPFAHRISAEVLGSDGSSSMATVCAGSMALMDSGAPLRKPVAGVAMGLVTGPSFTEGNDEDFVLLTDILGAEDHFGDMDMKVTGTADGLTATQLDVKPHFGITMEIIEKALEEARKARLHILSQMEKTIKEKRDMPSHSPRVLEVAVDHGLTVKTLMKDRASGLNEIQDQSGAILSYQNRRKCIVVEAPNEASAEKAVELIKKVLGNLEIGSKMMGTVTEVKQTYAVISVASGSVSGVLHISKMQLSRKAGGGKDSEDGVASTGSRYPDVRSLVSVNDTLEVVVLESDRAKGIVRFGLTSPPSQENHEELSNQIDSILSASGSSASG